ncbi:MAG: hypothetical protein ACSHX3_09720 [Litorimonas sp.]
MNILSDWSDQDRRAYGSEIQTFSHNLAQSGLFTDAALVSLLDRYSCHLVDVCTMIEQAGAVDDPSRP